MLKTFELCEGTIRESLTEGCTVLIFAAPDEEERRGLVERYKLDEHTLNSALDPDELARLEFEPEHVAVIYKRPKNYFTEHGLAFRVASSGLYLFKDKLIVVQPEDINLFEGKPFARLRSLPEVMLKLIYRSIFHFLEHLKVINSIFDELEQKINTAMENRYLINMFALEKSLVYYLNALNGNGALCEKLKNNAAKIGFTPEELEYLDDLIVENSQCARQAEIYSNILASLMDARASIVGNNLNVLMKRLNLITIGIMVPTFVVSAFSMNVGIPLAGFQYAFWAIMGLAAASVLAFMIFWWRKGT
jgi:magnesium transporter